LHEDHSVLEFIKHYCDYHNASVTVLAVRFATQTHTLPTVCYRLWESDEWFWLGHWSTNGRSREGLSLVFYSI